MRTQLERHVAKEKIVHFRYLTLRDFEKLRILEGDYPFLEDAEYIEEFIAEGDLPNLDAETIELIKSKKYLKIPFDSKLKPIFIESLMDDLYGVTNEYLELFLNRREQKYEVVGNIEKMGLCPCCEFYSIGYGEDGFCDICPVCFWEDGGDSPNHMRLEDAKANFKLIGAMNKESLRFVLPDGKIKYERKVKD